METIGEDVFVFYVPPWTLKIILLPIASMYGIFTYIYHKNQPFM